LISARIVPDPDHAVYQGHFPGFPITPGAAQACMIRHILGEALGTPYRMSRTRFIKWTSMHRPDEARELVAMIAIKKEGDRLSVNATLQAGTETCMKLKGEYLEQRTYIQGRPGSHR